MLSILFWVLLESQGIKNYRNLQNNKVSITQDFLLTQQNNNTVSAELIDRIEKHNKDCEAHYELYQETRKWFLLGKGDSALDLKIEIPQHENINTETTETPTYQTTVIDGSEYELVPKDNIH